MQAELLIVGSELVSGDKLDTNGQWLCRRLAGLGIPVRSSTVLGDNPADCLETFLMAAARSDLVVVSGGLGPTQDDLTRETLAGVAGVPLVEDPGSVEAIRAMFSRRNRTMPERNRVQALLPVGSEALFNRVGTAPGIWMHSGRAWFACLPGVPYELFIMFDEQVKPRLRSIGLSPGVIIHRVINTFGLGESDVEARAMDLTFRGREPEVGITASDATIALRIRGVGADEDEAMRATEETAKVIYARFGPLVLGEGDEDVHQATARALMNAGKTLAVAESCTGGLIASRLTNVAGISDVFRGGVVSYATEVKTTVLGVPAALIEEKGVVSAEVAEAMAEGVRKTLGAEIGLSVTGVAGPGGGTEETPVGCVYVGRATAEGVRSMRLDIGSEQPRHVIQSRAAKRAMNWVRLYLMGAEGWKPPPPMIP
jgi:nicotinamide-nucleotide amidase